MKRLKPTSGAQISRNTSIESAPIRATTNVRGGILRKWVMSGLFGVKRVEEVIHQRLLFGQMGQVDFWILVLDMSEFLWAGRSQQIGVFDEKLLEIIFGKPEHMVISGPVRKVP